MKPLIAALTLVGCAVVVKAFTVPYNEVCDAARGCTGNRLPSLISDVNYGLSWRAALPAVGLVLAVVAATALMLMYRSGRRLVAAGVLTIAGAVTFAFFVWLVESSFPGRPGGVLGALGGSLIALGGMVAVVWTLRSGTASP